jgi:hypothetical protein
MRSEGRLEAIKSRRDKFDTNAREDSSVRRTQKLIPDAFYDPDYRFNLRNLSVELIDRFGPITHRDLCQKIARMHGFQRTGSQIRQTIWAAVHKERKIQKGPSGENIFWPSHQAPQEIIEFRGLEFYGKERAWKHVPYPEKLGLALEAISISNRHNALGYMVKRLGLGRLTESTRTELEVLLREAKGVKEKDKNRDGR